MSKPLLSRKHTRFPLLLSDDGQNQEKLDLKEQKEEENGSTISMMLENTTMEENQKKRKRSMSVTQESVVTIKKKTSLDKSINSSQLTQTTKSSKTSALDSIGKENVLLPFWSESCLELSKKLWLATKIGCVDLDMSSLSKSVKSLIQNSWFSIKMKENLIQQKNSQTISLQSPHISPQKTMDFVQEKIDAKGKKEKKRVKKKTKKNPEKEEVQLKVKKIQIYPNQKEKEILRRWLGSCRLSYNLCLDAVNNNKSKISKKELRAFCINLDSESVQKHLFLKETPYDIRDEGMNDLIKAYKNAFSKGEKFKIKFRSKKDHQQSIVIHHKHWKHKRGAYEFIKNIKSAEEYPEVKHDSRLILDKLNRWFISIPVELEIKSETQRPENNIISLDPGVRTFMTGYDPEGRVIEVGKGDIGRIFRLSYKYDKFQSLVDKSKFNRKTRKNIKRKMLYIREKIRNIVKDVHCKLAKYLCTTYNNILLPEFKSQSMINKKDRKIGSKTARAIMTWSHYTFQQLLLNKAKEYPWVNVFIVTEEFTSKTCGKCGKLNEKLGSKKEFECSSCDFKSDRDINGARNILIKFLKE